MSFNFDHAETPNFQGLLNELDAINKGEQSLVRALYSDSRCRYDPNKPDCAGDLAVGIFFDGTNNNKYVHYGKDDYNPSVPFKKRQHTNVARLFMAYPDERDRFRVQMNKAGSGNRYFKFYVPGIGTEFPEVGDDGLIHDKTSGIAAGLALNGEVRVLYGMAQVVNAINMFYTDKELIGDAELKSKLDDIVTGKGKQTPRYNKYIDEGDPAVAAAYESAEYIYDRFIVHDDARVACFTEWLNRLKPIIAVSKPRLSCVNIDVFGFSRGATEARVFANWMVQVFKKPNGIGPLWFEGILVRFRFIGIFDTVASVGWTGMWAGEGRNAWAHKNLQIPPEMRHCVHLAAAHETRACFPMDSVRIDGHYPENESIHEIVYPGSHSDVGGGYVFESWGKNDLHEDGKTDMQIARVACFDMYLRALEAGVPFYSIEQLRELNPAMMSSFLPDRTTILRMKEYMELANIKGPVEDQLRAHLGLYLASRWLLGREYVSAGEMLRLGIQEIKGDDYVVKAKKKELDEVLDQYHKKNAILLTWKRRDSVEAERIKKDIESLKARRKELCDEIEQATKQIEPFLEGKTEGYKQAQCLWETQRTIAEVITKYCCQIFLSDNTDDAPAFPSLFTPRSLSIEGGLFREAGSFGIYNVRKHLQKILPSPLYNSNYEKTKAEAARDLVLYKWIGVRERYAERIYKLDRKLGWELINCFTLSRYAPMYLKRWRDYLTQNNIAELHRTKNPEREPIWLLEALADIEERSEEFITSATEFFADHVHDSAAGFIYETMLINFEYLLNGYGLAKFRRVYFGNNADQCLCDKVQERNEAALAQIDAKKKEQEAEKMRQELELEQAKQPVSTAPPNAKVVSGAGNQQSCLVPPPKDTPLPPGLRDGRGATGSW
jgi:hypothetical protein